MMYACWLLKCVCMTDSYGMFMNKICIVTVADLHSKSLDVRSPLPRVQILSISCSFWGNLAKSYVGALLGELAPPPKGNPASATG